MNPLFHPFNLEFLISKEREIVIDVFYFPY
jgi:hypothetical protein